jgi:hypothetical protein
MKASSLGLNIIKNELLVFRGVPLQHPDSCCNATVSAENRVHCVGEWNGPRHDSNIIELDSKDNVNHQRRRYYLLGLCGAGELSRRPRATGA